MSFVAFDLLALDVWDVMTEPSRDRRKRLEDVIEGHELRRVGVVSVSDTGPLL